MTDPIREALAELVWCADASGPACPKGDGWRKAFAAARAALAAPVVAQQAIDAAIADSTRMCDAYVVENQQLSDEIDRLRAALAAPVPAQPDTIIRDDFERRMRSEGKPIQRLQSGSYFSPTVERAWEDEKRKYVTQPVAQEPLTEAKLQELFTHVNKYGDSRTHWWIEYGRAVERAVRGSKS